jgi:hypothetical protein
MGVEMNSNGVLGVAAVVLGSFAACNYTDGECFPREELYETSGAGGGVIVPTGVGGFGAVPYETQDATDTPPPECNIVSGGPCDEKCQAQYDAASITCGKIEDPAQRRACQDKAHAEYKACEETCEQQANKTCLEKWEDCTNAVKGPYWCRLTVPNTSSTYCQQCWHSCNARNAPSANCVKCGF